MTDQTGSPRLTESQEARFRVLERMRHDRWCTWQAQRDCNCKAGRLMLALIESEAQSLSGEREGIDVERLARAAHDAWQPPCSAVVHDHNWGPDSFYGSFAERQAARLASLPTEGGER